MRFSAIALILSLAAAPQALSQELLVERANTTLRGGRSFTNPVLPGSRRIRTFSTRSASGEDRTIDRISVTDGRDLNQVIESYRKQPGVLSVEVNQQYNTLETSNDPRYLDGSLWGMYSDDSPASGPTGTTNAFGSQAEQAWLSGQIGSMRTIVGVVDTGIDYTHPDLYLNIYLNQEEIPSAFRSGLIDIDGDGVITFRDLNSPLNSSFVSDLNSNSRIDGGDLLQDSRWENGVDEDSNGYVDDLVGWNFVSNNNNPMDDNNHGTHVAGTIGAMGGNSIGVAGVSWRIQLVPLKFLNSSGSGWGSDAISAINYFTNATLAQDRAFKPGSQLTFLGTNNSWGGGGFSTLLRTAIVNSASARNHFLAAAGNNGVNTDLSPFYPSAYTTLPEATWEAVTSVASLDSSGARSYFSNYGVKNVDIGAPGSGILSTAPNGSYLSLNGTSMATPHVMGALALYASAYPTVYRTYLRSILLGSTTSTPSLVGKVFSNGRLDLQRGLNFFNLPSVWGTLRSEVINGSSNAEYITGVTSSGTTPQSLGRGQIDQVFGGAGTDIFRLGQYRGGTPYVFYNTGVSSTTGSKDYIFIRDFNRNEDRIGFVAGRYFVRFSTVNSLIYWDRNNNGVLNLNGTNQDELIGIVRNTNLGNLTITEENSPSWSVFIPN